MSRYVSDDLKAIQAHNTGALALLRSGGSAAAVAEHLVKIDDLVARANTEIERMRRKLNEVEQGARLVPTLRRQLAAKTRQIDFLHSPNVSSFMHN